MTETVLVNDQVLDRYVTHQVQVLRLASGVADEVVARLLKADRETYQTIAAYANSDGVVLGHVHRLLGQVEKTNTAAYRDVYRTLKSELVDLSDYEIEFGRDLMTNVLPFSYRTRKPKRAMVVAAVDDEPMAGGLLSEWVQGMEEGRFSRLRAAIRMSVSKQENVVDAVKRIRGTKSLGYRDGVSAINLRSAKAMTMTVFNHISTRARRDFYGRNIEIVTGYMWSAVLDDLTCPECGELDGEEFPPDDYDFMPPLHINCRCVLTPILSPIDDDDFSFPKAKKLKYEAWLNKQTATLQDEILGPARAAMFRSGLALKKFTDASGLKYNLVDLRKIEAKTMTKKSDAAKTRSTKVLRNWGWKPDVPDLRDHLFGLAHPQEVQLPPKISLRDKMPPVFDQGDIGSCVANACVTAHMFVHKTEAMMSRLDLYWNARYLEGMVDEDSGVMIRDGVKALAKFGVCTEKTWPYRIRKFRVDPPDKADHEALAYKITSYSRLSSLGEYQRCLAAGYPFVFGFGVYDNIFDSEAANQGILTMPTKKMQLIGAHAVLAIGYDTDFHNNQVFKNSELSADDVPSFMFEIRNSWGDGYGDAGNFWMPADYLNNRDLTDDYWTIRA